ncbi:hypothetical protein HYW35_04300 [Candidatus Saccharibacteria bacterium]|nr:hypothetical protein [Candidatus Saccharibacteria bacterium]
MANTYWLKQTRDKPLFEDLLWSRPENKRYAGKLLIVGGNLHGFAAPGSAYGAALKADIGTCRILLPDNLKKIVTLHFSHLQGSSLEIDYAPSTLSGSFSKTTLAQLLESAEWADGVLLAGDFGRNSETAILLEGFMNKFAGQVTIAQDGLDYFWGSKSPLIERFSTLSVINLGKLQKLAKHNRPATPILHNMMLADLVATLHDWTTANPGQIITRHADHFIIASGGQVSTTSSAEESNWQIELAAYASVWWLQQPQKPFEALTSSVFDYLKEK